MRSPRKPKHQGTYPVLPEHVQLGVGHHDTVEQTEDNQETRQDVADDSEAGRPGADPLAPAGLEQEEQQRHEEDVTGRGRVVGQARGQVPQQPVQHGGDERAGDLGEHLGGAEGDPAVDAGRVLAGLPQGEVGEEFGQDGVQNLLLLC